MSFIKRKILKANTSNVDTIKNNLRLHFRERMKHFRQEQCNRQRNLMDDMEKMHLKTEYALFKQILLNDLKLSELSSEDEVLNIMNEVESELLLEERQKEAEEYLNESKTELEALISSSATVCSICDNYIYELCGSSCGICKSCADLHFNTNIL